MKRMRAILAVLVVLAWAVIAQAQSTTTTTSTSSTTSTSTSTSSTTSTSTSTTSTSTSTSTSSTTTTSTTTQTDWSLIRNADCTGVGVASGLTTTYIPCCTGVRSGTCDDKYDFGSTFERQAYLVPCRRVANTMACSGTSSKYTTGGDAIPAVEWSRIGYHTLVYASCNIAVKGAPPTTAFRPVIQRNASGSTVNQSRPFKIQLYGGAASGVAFAEAAGNTSVVDYVLDCLFYGR